MLSMLGWRVLGNWVMPMVSVSRCGWASAGRGEGQRGGKGREERAAMHGLHAGAEDMVVPRRPAG